MKPKKLRKLLLWGLSPWLLLLLLVGNSSGQSLKGGHHRCLPQQEGQYVPVKMPGGIRVKCKCVRGILDSCQYPGPACDKSLEGCHYVEDSKHGICPQVCSSCVQNGTRYESGKSWPDPADKCKTNQCFSGVVTKSDLQCPPTMCSNPTVKPGECCPSCERCFRGLQPFEEGETKADILDPCNECTCRKGHLTCVRKACPVLPCKDRLVKKIPGRCCPVCSRRHEAAANIKGKCLFKEKIYGVGSSFSPDKCTDCTCTSSLTTVCERKTCPPLPCAKSSQVPSADGCCSECASPPPQSDSLPANRPSHCVYDGSTYLNGDAWTDDCKRCSCVQGETKCALNECAPLTCPPNMAMVKEDGECCPKCKSQHGICTVFGDPHYKTFDGRIFNFQGSCKYLLASDCGGSNSSFSIRITNDARDSMAFSWLRTITMRLDGVKVSLLQKMKVKVDGKTVKLPYLKMGSLSVIKDGYRVILRTNTGVRLLWDGVSFLELTVPSKYHNRMCGLCGNFNGDSRDDFYGRHGSVFPDGQSFGDTWRVGGMRACSVLPRDMPHAYEPQCTQSWESKIKSDRNCNALNSTLFHSCQSRVDSNYYFNACKLDMCECPGETCHCEVLTAYARECERAGVLVHNWRQHTGCENVTSFMWNKHGGNIYRTSPSQSLNEVYSSPDSLPSSTSSTSKIEEESRRRPKKDDERLGVYLPGCSLANADKCRQPDKSDKTDTRSYGLSEEERRRQEERKQRKRERRKLKRQERRRKRKEMRRLKKRLMKSQTRRGSRHRKKKGKKKKQQATKGSRRTPQWPSLAGSDGKRPSFEMLMRLRESSPGEEKNRDESEEDVEATSDSSSSAPELASGSALLWNGRDYSDSLASAKQSLMNTRGSRQRTPLPLAEDRPPRSSSSSASQRRKNWKRKRRRTAEA